MGRSHYRGVCYECHNWSFVSDRGISLRFRLGCVVMRVGYVLIRFVALGCHIITIGQFLVTRSVTNLGSRLETIRTVPIESTMRCKSDMIFTIGFPIWGDVTRAYTTWATDWTSFRVSKLKRRLHRLVQTTLVKMPHCLKSHVASQLLWMKVEPNN